MPAIQKPFSFNFVLVAATLAVLPSIHARADVNSDAAAAYGLGDADTAAEFVPVADDSSSEPNADGTSSRLEAGGTAALIHAGDATRGAMMGNLVYRHHREGVISPSDTSEGNVDHKLDLQLGATGDVDGPRRMVGRAKYDYGNGGRSMGITGIDANSQRVRYLSPTIGMRYHFSDGKSYATLLANPIGGQKSSNTGMHVARSSADVELHLAVNDKATLDAAGGFGLLYLGGSGSGTSSNLSTALTVDVAKLGENSNLYMSAGVSMDRNTYPYKDDSNTDRESQTTLTGMISAGIAR